MKIAICLYGHHRSFSRAIESWIPFYTEYNPDVFIHTWDTIGFKTADTRPDLDASPYVRGAISDDATPVTMGSFDQISKWTKNIVIESYEDRYTDFVQMASVIHEYQQTVSVHHSINVHSKYAQAYTSFQAHQLSSIDTYDIIISTRPDAKLTSYTDFFDIGSNTLYSDLYQPNLIYGLVRYGTQDVMNKTLNFYNDYLSVFETGKTTNRPELCFDVHPMVSYYTLEHNNFLLTDAKIRAAILR